MTNNRWPIKPEVKFVDQYGEDKTISVSGNPIKYTEWVKQVFGELVVDLPNKAYDDYRKTFEQGKNYIRIIFESTDAFPVFPDVQKTPTIPSWIRNQIKDQLHNTVILNDCEITIFKNFYDNQFIYSTHTLLNAIRIDNTVLMNHVRCIAVSLGVDPKMLDNFEHVKELDEHISILRRVIKEQYWSQN